jgi:hypothetical protein
MRARRRNGIIFRHVFGPFTEGLQAMIERVSRVLGSAALMLGMAACGSSTEVVAPTVNVSIGQQLIDLKKARDSGALSQSQWEEQKNSLIRSVE